jgi:hypothetical protein
MREIFLGKPLHWLIWVVIIAVLFFMGRGFLHVRAFNAFFTVVALLGFGAVAFVLLSSHENERVTRDAFGDIEPTQRTTDD